MTDLNELVQSDYQHLLHPLHHPSAHASPLIIESGQGVWLKTVDGRKFIDGLAGLWNVLIGHGRVELADRARAQMADLAFFSNYAGVANVPAIELAERLAGFAYPNLNMTYFASGGAEANETAFKTARFYWKRRGKPEVKVLYFQSLFDAEGDDGGTNLPPAEQPIQLAMFAM